MFRHQFFAVLIAVVVVVATLHIPGLYFFWYWKVAWLDLLTHFGGGFWVGGMLVFLAYALWGDRFEQSRGNFFRVALLSAAGTFAVGVGWEIFEVLADALSMAEPGYWSDTAIDMAADVTGAAAASLYFFLRGYYEAFPSYHEKK